MFIVCLFLLAIVPLFMAKEQQSPCPTGYEHYNKYCYKAFTDKDKHWDWPDAEKQCKIEEAELVSIHDELERQFVNVLTLKAAMKNGERKKQYGIGFFWTGMKLKWEGKDKLEKVKWTDETPVDFLNPKEWGMQKRPVFFDNADAAGYNKKAEECTVFGQWVREPKEYMKLESALDEHGLDVLWLDFACDEMSDKWYPHGAVCKKKAKEGGSYGKPKYGDADATEEDVKNYVKFVTSGSGTYMYAEGNTYMLLMLKEKYGKGMSEEDRKKVCSFYKSQFVIIKDEPKEAKEYMDKLVEKTKTTYSDSSDHMFCKFTGTMGGCGEFCKKGY